MTRRYELTDEAYGLIADLLPPKGQRGGQWNDHRQTLNGLLWILSTGAHWRELPESKCADPAEDHYPGPAIGRGRR